MPEKRELTIDPQFTALSLAVPAEEDGLLRASLQSEGCREPLIIWEQTGIILDGHRRFAACNDLKINFKTKVLSFAGRDEAHAWVVTNQLARRNLTEEQKAYLRGKRYLAERHTKGGDHSSDKAKAHFEPLLTARRLGEELRVSASTIKRDAEFAQAIDAIAEVSPGLKSSILSRAIRIPRKELLETARLKPSERQCKAFALLTGKIVRQSPFKPPPSFEPRPEGDKFVHRVALLIRRWPQTYRPYLVERLKDLVKLAPSLPWDRRKNDPWPNDLIAEARAAAESQQVGDGG